MTYNPGVPTGSIPLNQDYLNLQANFTQINSQFLIDHVPLTSTSGIPPNGYHKAIHLVPVSTTASNPPNNQPINGYTATPGYGQIFDATINDGINTDQALFFLTGANRLMQLTRNFVPVASANGYTYLAGGLILQWGNFNPNISTVVTFPIAFPANVFNIQLTGSASNNSTFRNGVATGTLTNTGFTWQGTVDSHWTPIYYMVIGN